MGSVAETTFKGLKAVDSKPRKLITLNDQSAVENYADLWCIYELQIYLDLRRCMPTKILPAATS